VSVFALVQILYSKIFSHKFQIPPVKLFGSISAIGTFEDILQVLAHKHNVHKSGWMNEFIKNLANNTQQQQQELMPAVIHSKNFKAGIQFYAS
jgi:hypothetical protein